MTIKLRGITWNHSRGYVPMVATAQRFSETHPGVEITWEKRSLQEFADYPIQKLVDKYDLLVIDHPWVGFAASNEVLLPLDKYLPSDFIKDQSENSVGLSHESYRFNNNQYALAIDAATPVASYRPDLLEKNEISLPQTWEDLLKLARQGKVVFPGIPIDTLMNFYMLCTTLGEEPFLSEELVVSMETGIRALEMLRELSAYCTTEIFEWNPIAVYEAMTSRDDYAYCPFAYGYSNYSRKGYAKNLLIFTDLVEIEGYGKLRSTLGGTGLAISINCSHKEIAVEYAQFVANPECQKTLYVENGGQPGHRKAWIDEKVNQNYNNYFINTLPALDRAYLRPRYNGYLHFQDHAGIIVQEYVRFGGDPKHTLERLDIFYRESKEVNQK